MKLTVTPQAPWSNTSIQVELKHRVLFVNDKNHRVSVDLSPEIRGMQGDKYNALFTIEAVPFFPDIPEENQFYAKLNCWQMRKVKIMYKISPYHNDFVVWAQLVIAAIMAVVAIIGVCLLS